MAMKVTDIPAKRLENLKGVMPMELTENEKKKQFLMSYLQAKRDVERIELQLAELRLNKLTPSMAPDDGMPHASDISDLSEYAAKVDELERELLQRRYKRIRAFKKVQSAIEKMENEQEKTLLTYRYMVGLKWEAIAVKMGYSWQHIHKIHASALKKLKMR